MTDSSAPPASRADIVGVYQPVVAELRRRVLQDPVFAAALVDAIEKAKLPDVASLLEFFQLLNSMVTSLPSSTSRLLGNGLEVYFVVGQSQALQEDPNFTDWLVRFAGAMGAFMDTPASAEHLDGFIFDSQYALKDYAPGPSGWLSFNQFFARQIRPGLRSVAAPENHRVIASPCDAQFQGTWAIEDEWVRIKDADLNIQQLLADSPYASRFRHGCYCHMFLQAYNYHRFHAPCGGELLQVEKIPGEVSLDVVRDAGNLKAQPGTGFQFVQDRGLVVLDSPCGLVAVLPVGMAQISSVNFSATPLTVVAKGDELGFFQFGGSDVVVVFEHAPGEIAPAGTMLKQGERLAEYF